jgi:hypothetical protein
LISSPSIETDVDHLQVELPAVRNKVMTKNGKSLLPKLFEFNHGFLSTLGNIRSKVLKILSTPFLATQQSGESHLSVTANANAAASNLGFSTRPAKLILLGFSFLSCESNGIIENVEIRPSGLKWREHLLPQLYMLRHISATRVASKNANFGGSVAWQVMTAFFLSPKNLKKSSQPQR